MLPRRGVGLAALHVAVQLSLLGSARRVSSHRCREVLYRKTFRSAITSRLRAGVLDLLPKARRRAGTRGEPPRLCPRARRNRVRERAGPGGGTRVRSDVASPRPLASPAVPAPTLGWPTARRPSEPRADRSTSELRRVASRRNAVSAQPLASGHCRRGAAHCYAATVRDARSDARAISAAVRRCASRLLRRGVGFIKPRRPRLPRVFARRERSRLHPGLVQTGTSRRDRGRGGPDRASPRGRRASVEDRSSPKGGPGCRAARVGLTSERPSGIGLQPQPSSTRGRRSQ